MGACVSKNRARDVIDISRQTPPVSPPPPPDRPDTAQTAEEQQQQQQLHQQEVVYTRVSPSTNSFLRTTSSSSLSIVTTTAIASSVCSNLPFSVPVPLSPPPPESTPANLPQSRSKRIPSIRNPGPSQPSAEEVLFLEQKYHLSEIDITRLFEIFLAQICLFRNPNPSHEPTRLVLMAMREFCAFIDAQARDPSPSLRMFTAAGSLPDVPSSSISTIRGYHPEHQESCTVPRYSIATTTTQSFSTMSSHGDMEEDDEEAAQENVIRSDSVAGVSPAPFVASGFHRHQERYHHRQQDSGEVLPYSGGSRLLSGVSSAHSRSPHRMFRSQPAPSSSSYALATSVSSTNSPSTSILTAVQIPTTAVAQHSYPFSPTTITPPPLEPFIVGLLSIAGLSVPKDDSPCIPFLKFADMLCYLSSLSSLQLCDFTFFCFGKLPSSMTFTPSWTAQNSATVQTLRAPSPTSDMPKAIDRSSTSFATITLLKEALYINDPEMSQLAHLCETFKPLPAIICEQARLFCGERTWQMLFLDPQHRPPATSTPTGLVQQPRLQSSSPLPSHQSSVGYTDFKRLYFEFECVRFGPEQLQARVRKALGVENHWSQKAELFPVVSSSSSSDLLSTHQSFPFPASRTFPAPPLHSHLSYSSTHTSSYFPASGVASAVPTLYPSHAETSLSASGSPPQPVLPRQSLFVTPPVENSTPIVARSVSNDGKFSTPPRTQPSTSLHHKSPSTLLAALSHLHASVTSPPASTSPPKQQGTTETVTSQSSPERINTTQHPQTSAVPALVPPPDRRTSFTTTLTTTTLLDSSSVARSVSVPDLQPSSISSSTSNSSTFSSSSTSYSSALPKSGVSSAVHTPASTDLADAALAPVTLPSVDLSSSSNSEPQLVAIPATIAVAHPPEMLNPQPHYQHPQHHAGLWSMSSSVSLVSEVPAGDRTRSVAGPPIAILATPPSHARHLSAFSMFGSTTSDSQSSVPTPFTGQSSALPPPAAGRMSQPLPLHSHTQSDGSLSQSLVSPPLQPQPVVLDGPPPPSALTESTDGECAGNQLQHAYTHSGITVPTQFTAGSLLPTSISSPHSVHLAPPSSTISHTTSLPFVSSSGSPPLLSSSSSPPCALSSSSSSPSTSSAASSSVASSSAASSACSATSFVCSHEMINRLWSDLAQTKFKQLPKLHMVDNFVERAARQDLPRNAEQSQSSTSSASTSGTPPRPSGPTGLWMRRAVRNTIRQLATRRSVSLPRGLESYQQQQHLDSLSAVALGCDTAGPLEILRKQIQLGQHTINLLHARLQLTDGETNQARAVDSQFSSSSSVAHQSSSSMNDIRFPSEDFNRFLSTLPTRVPTTITNNNPNNPPSSLSVVATLDPVAEDGQPVVGAITRATSLARRPSLSSNTSPLQQLQQQHDLNRQLLWEHDSGRRDLPAGSHLSDLDRQRINMGLLIAAPLSLARQRLPSTVSIPSRRAGSEQFNGNVDPSGPQNRELSVVGGASVASLSYPVSDVFSPPDQGAESLDDSSSEDCSDDKNVNEREEAEEQHQEAFPLAPEDPGLAPNQQPVSLFSGDQPIAPASRLMYPAEPTHRHSQQPCSVSPRSQPSIRDDLAEASPLNTCDQSSYASDLEGSSRSPSGESQRLTNRTPDPPARLTHPPLAVLDLPAPHPAPLPLPPGVVTTLPTTVTATTASIRDTLVPVNPFAANQQLTEMRNMETVQRQIRLHAQLAEVMSQHGFQDAAAAGLQSVEIANFLHLDSTTRVTNNGSFPGRKKIPAALHQRAGVTDPTVYSSPLQSTPDASPLTRQTHTESSPSLNTFISSSSATTSYTSMTAGRLSPLLPYSLPTSIAVSSTSSTSSTSSSPAMMSNQPVLVPTLRRDGSIPTAPPADGSPSTTMHVALPLIIPTTPDPVLRAVSGGGDDSHISSRPPRSYHSSSVGSGSRARRVALQMKDYHSAHDVAFSRPRSLSNEREDGKRRGPPPSGSMKLAAARHLHRLKRSHIRNRSLPPALKALSTTQMLAPRSDEANMLLRMRSSDPSGSRLPQPAAAQPPPPPLLSAFSSTSMPESSDFDHDSSNPDLPEASLLTAGPGSGLAFSRVPSPARRHSLAMASATPQALSPASGAFASDATASADRKSARAAFSPSVAGSGWGGPRRPMQRSSNSPSGSLVDSSGQRFLPPLSRPLMLSPAGKSVSVTRVRPLVSPSESDSILEAQQQQHQATFASWPERPSESPSSLNATQRSRSSQDIPSSDDISRISAHPPSLTRAETSGRPSPHSHRPEIILPKLDKAWMRSRVSTAFTPSQMIVATSSHSVIASREQRDIAAAAKLASPTPPPAPTAPSVGRLSPGLSPSGGGPVLAARLTPSASAVNLPTRSAYWLRGAPLPSNAILSTDHSVNSDLTLKSDSAAGLFSSDRHTSLSSSYSASFQLKGSDSFSSPPQSETLPSTELASSLSSSHPSSSSVDAFPLPPPVFSLSSGHTVSHASLSRSNRLSPLRARRALLSASSSGAFELQFSGRSVMPAPLASAFTSPIEHSSSTLVTAHTPSLHSENGSSSSSPFNSRPSPLFDHHERPSKSPRSLEPSS